MGIEISWRSQTGTRTDDNRDYGGVGLRGDEALCVVLDGSTKGPDSGALARQIASALIDWYVSTDQDITAEALTARLREIHAALSHEHLRGSASYMIVHVQSAHTILVLHAGDCLLGQVEEDGGITWMCQPHTLANIVGEIPVAEIARLAVRHRLTRSFRPREFMPPDATQRKIPKDSILVLGTDGFWAELSAREQDQFLNGNDVSMTGEGDDRSALCIRIIDGATGSVVRDPQFGAENFYVKTAP
ncbi:hypothetical protein ASD50_03625 [Mesorhizobium sp. Root552]|uniref:PP2C family protein-serine/threonine phosphatase n=1 Tax=Mesorhizobium sp. Root552 TaxID=1736555 RepID=UPI0006FBE392|nr:protein phosphatase 2C domain-containing protein [Mesorhizobium sp. Root552]KQZ26508.1 hypothetical protein ASD50_03625 [Mesorhizobium sp. Root552]